MDKKRDCRIGSYFSLNNRRCEVLTVDGFGGEEHFGFRTVDIGTPITGWVPTKIVGQTELSE